MRAIHKKTVATTLMALLCGSASAANNDVTYIFKMNVDGKTKVPEWITINYIYDAWINQGAPYNCASWSPSAETIDWGKTFQQSRMCSQNQTRTNTPVQLNPVLGTTKTGQGFSESRTISTTQFQASTGTMDFVSGERAAAWEEWVDSGSHYGCSAWTPKPETVDLNSDFKQSRNCSQDQTRTRQVYSVWASGKESPKRIDSESQTITESESQQNTGTRDFVAGQRIGNWSSWTDENAPYDCGVWTPSPENINLDESFTQSRNCSQSQRSERNIYDVWESGKESLSQTELRTQTISATQTQPAVGTKDYIVTTSNDEWSAWSDTGSKEDCSSWSPAASTVNLGEAFTQNRSCSQSQTASRDVYNVWKSGKRTLKDTETKTQAVTVNETQGAIGTKDFTSTTENGAWSSWSNAGSVFDCSSWTPETSTVNLGETVTQTRTCSQKQTAERNVYDVWQSGKKTVSRTETKEQTVSVNQSQQATGTKDYISGTSYGSWAAWENDGTVYGCTAWTPSPSTVNLDQSFTQSRSCYQKQTSQRDVYNVWKSGQKTLKTTEERAQTITVSQTQSGKGSKDYVTGIESGPFGAWSNDGQAYNCTAWTPASSTVDLDKSYTQSRDCSQKQTRTQTIYNVWKSGAKTEKTTNSESQVISVPETQSATGSKDYIVGTSTKAWSPWVNSGAQHSCGDFGPAPKDQTANFTQTQSCSQDQVREREIYNVWKSGKETLKTTEPDAQTIGKTNSRSVSVSWTSWTNSGTPTGCGAWSPEQSTVNLGESFTQSRTCSQSQVRNRVYKSGSSTLLTTPEPKSVSINESRTVSGTKDYISGVDYSAWSSWSDVGGAHSCGAWSPVPSSVNLGETFTQTRSCKQDQSASRNVYDVWASGKKTLKETETRTQAVTVSQSKSATGTKDYIASTRAGSWSAWTNSGGQHTCGGWSPSANTQTSSFTQSQSCKQNQVRNRTIYDVWASGKETVNRTESGTQTVNATNSRSVTVSWTSWVNSGSPASCGAWSPDPSTVNLGSSFTQTRSCTQAQTRNRVYKTGSTTINTMAESQSVNVTQSQSSTGSKDYIATTRTGSWSAWANSGAQHTCGGWSPATGTQTSGFTQSQTCKQNQTRSRTIYNVWASGKETVKSTEPGAQTINATNSRSVTVSWTSWVNSGSPTSCGTWSPDPSTVNLGASFTQTRSCSQAQTRNRIYKTGSTTLDTVAESQSISVSQSQTATGTKDYIATTRTGSWSAWANSGAQHTCGGWSPATGTQTSGFTQSQTCKQNQTRSRTIYNVWASGKETVKSTEPGAQTINATNSRSVAVSWTSWVNSGSPTSCGTWSPDPSTVNLGSSFTQTRSCTQAQTRNRLYKTGSTTLDTVAEAQNISVSQSQSATGSKDYVKSTRTGSWSAWVDSGSQHTCGGWSPAPTTQTTGFTQSQTCKQNQTRSRTIYNVWASGKETVKSTEPGTQTINETNSRSVSVSWSSWTNNGSVTGCSAWSPSPTTVNLGTSFTQSRSCTQPLKRTRYYKTGSSTLASFDEAGSTTANQTQSATGSKDYIINSNYTGSWSAWSNDGGQHSCSGWTPDPSTVDYGKSFSQSQSCKQNQKRSRSIYNQWKSGNLTLRTTENGAQTITVSNSRTSTGTKNIITGSKTTYGAWQYSQTVCDTYSPSTSSVNLGQSFTQTRYCYKRYSRTRTENDVWADGSVTAKSTSTEYQNDPKYADTKTATGTKDYVTNSNYEVHSHYSYSAWSCGTWSPSTSTVTSGQTFTQTRDCNRTRYQYVDVYYLYKSGAKVLKTSDVYKTSAPQSKTESQTATGTKTTTRPPFDESCPTYNEKLGTWTYCK